MSLHTDPTHATAVGKLFRPDSPLLPNYKWVPIGYHGRASSIVVSGTPIRRPRGQTLAPGATAPTVNPSQRLDYELELGALVGPGNALGEPVQMVEAEDRLFGLTLLNDWSARDLQAWEYQPLGPFLAKNFGGKQPISLPGGEQRTFLADGDTLILRARCQRAGAARIGFGDCAGTVLAAPAGG